MDFVIFETAAGEEKKMGKRFLYFDCVTGLAQYGTVAQKGNQQENKKK